MAETTGFEERRTGPEMHVHRGLFHGNLGIVAIVYHQHGLRALGGMRGDMQVVDGDAGTRGQRIVQPGKQGLREAHEAREASCRALRIGRGGDQHHALRCPAPIERERDGGTTQRMSDHAVGVSVVAADRRHRANEVRQGAQPTLAASVRRLIEGHRAQLDVVSAIAARDLAYVALYKALGGAAMPNPPLPRSVD